MLKKLVSLIALPLLLSGCATTLTNLTPQRQERNPNNLYPVEVAISTRQQTMRWESIHPKIVVGTDFYPMRPTQLMTNRWEGFVPVPAGTSLIRYRYKFDFDYNAFGKPKQDSLLSPEYTIRILQK
ncbi:MAG: hypothetical protein NTX27_04355 [Verrucomicrobia bacterium]|nr:hypothetical protein [Verrucomicrobiota bacterium]